MSFIQKNLLAKERIVARAEGHWWPFVFPLVIITVSLLFLFLPFPSNLKNTQKTYSIVAWGIVLFYSLRLLKEMFTSSFLECAVTDKRVLMKQGFIKTRSINAVLKKIEGVEVRKGVWGKVFNFGKINVTTGGVNEWYGPIHDPQWFQKRLMSSIDENA